MKKAGKINVDDNFKNYVSSRRYKGIKIFNILNNFVNYIGVRLFNRPFFNYLPEIR